MPTLPPPAELERICKGIAALDAMLWEDWESRYYSFNQKWSPMERMASMRNGCGDDWFIVFGSKGVFRSQRRSVCVPQTCEGGLRGEGAC